MMNLVHFSQKSVIFLIILVAFAPILNNFIEFDIAGFSFFVTVLPSFILILLYLINFKRIKKLHHYLLFSNCLFILLILLFRIAFYNELSLKSLGGVSFTLLIPIIFILFITLKIDEINRKTLLYLLIAVLIFNFVIALLYVLGFPTIQTADINSPDYYEFGRFTGIMGGANVQANFIYAVFMILTLCYFNLNIHKIFFLFSISIIAVIPTLSRSAIFGIIFILFYTIYIHIKSTKLRSNFILIITIFLSSFFIVFWIDWSFLENLNESFLARLSGEDLSGGRIAKWNFVINSLFSKISHITIGIPSVLQSNSVISISDNSITLLLANFGIPFTLFFALFIFKLIKDKIKTRKNSAIYLFLITIILIANNAVLWLPWVIYTILGFYLLESKNSNNYNTLSSDNAENSMNTI